jgi:hypothetical protein
LRITRAGDAQIAALYTASAAALLIAHPAAVSSSEQAVELTMIRRRRIDRAAVTKDHAVALRARQQLAHAAAAE